MKGAAIKGSPDVQATGGVEVISMLYDGALDFIAKAEEKIKTGDSAGRQQYIKKTTAIVKELSGSLNMDGGEIAINLKNLYDFVLERLVKADAENDSNALGDAGKVIEILRSAWQEMQEVRQMKSEQP